MPTLESADPSIPFTLLKGEPGTRKSTCALSYPTPQYWFSTDRKMGSLVLPAKRWGIKSSDIEYDDYTDWNGIAKKLKSFQLNCKFKHIIFDSATSIADNILNQTKGAKAGEDKGKVIGGIIVAGLEEFNAEGSAFSDLIHMTQDIRSYHGCMVTIIAHVIAQKKDNPNNQHTHYSRVIMTGSDVKVAAKIAAYSTEAYHFNIIPAMNVDQEGEYSLLTVHTGNDYARTSLPLERQIKFNNQPLYDKWIAPAILKLKNEIPLTKLPPVKI